MPPWYHPIQDLLFVNVDNAQKCFSSSFSLNKIKLAQISQVRQYQLKLARLKKKKKKSSPVMFYLLLERDREIILLLTKKNLFNHTRKRHLQIDCYSKWVITNTKNEQRSESVARWHSWPDGKIPRFRPVNSCRPHDLHLARDYVALGI